MDCKQLTRKWNALNNQISEEELFDLEMYQALYEETEAAILSIRENENFSKDEIELLLELSRFQYKEIMDEDQFEASEQVYSLLYDIFLNH